MIVDFEKITGEELSKKYLPEAYNIQQHYETPQSVDKTINGVEHIK